jgi:DNA repair protein SbcC/Rad50
MQLRRLRVKNIRSYEASALDFAPGTTLLVGDVGAGKTSLLYAIEMALFGVAEVDAAYLVRHGAAHAEVTVGFEDEDHAYEVFRRFRRVRRKGKETFEPEKIGFKVDGAETQYSATELRQRVIDLLGFPDNPNPQAHSDLWRWAVYVPQERMRDILAAKPQERLETVRKALGVERYRTAAENAAELATDLRRSAASRRAESERLHHYDTEFAGWSETGDRLRIERAGLEVTMDRRTGELAKARRAVEERSEAVRRSEADRRELESLTREQESDARSLAEHARARGERLEEIERRRHEREALQGRSSDLNELRGRLSKAESSLGLIRSDLDALAARLRQLAEGRAEVAAAVSSESGSRAAVERARGEVAEARTSLDAAVKEGPTKEPPAPTPDPLPLIEEKLAEARGREAELLATAARSRAALGEIEELLSVGTCPRCHQPVRAAEFGSHRAEAVAEAEGADARLRAAAAERERIEDERRARERYERAHDRWVEVERRRAAARAALEKATATLGSAERTLTEATHHLEEVRARAEALAPLEAEENRLKTELSAADRRRAALAQGVEDAAIAEERIRSMLAAEGALQSEVARLDQEAGTIRTRSEVRAGRVSDLEPLVHGAVAAAEELGRAEKVREAAETALQTDRISLAKIDARLDEAVRGLATAERGRAERAALVAEADTIERKAAWIARPFREAVLTMEQQLLSHAQAVFERSFARYFASLVDDPGLIARTDVAFTPAVTIDGEWTPAEALSGGERTSLALAFRLALAQVVRSMGDLRLDTILLDEPTDGFSPEQVIRMGELLDELALPQVVIVSHEGQLAAIADRVVRVEKHDGRSELSFVDPRTRRDGSAPAAAV